MPLLVAFGTGDAPGAAPHPVSPSPAARSRRREFLSFPLCVAAEVSVFPRTPPSGKDPSPLRGSHLQGFAGKCGDSAGRGLQRAKSEGRGVFPRSQGIKAAVGSDGLPSRLPVRIPHAPSHEAIWERLGAAEKQRHPSPWVSSSA